MNPDPETTVLIKPIKPTHIHTPYTKPDAHPRGERLEMESFLIGLFMGAMCAFTVTAIIAFVALHA